MNMDADMSKDRTGHSQRLLNMYDVLQRGCGLSTRSLQERFGVTAKSVQRDIAELREYISQEYAQSVYGNIEYNRVRKEYYWRNRSDMLLHEREILLIATILLESRGLTSGELHKIIDKMLVQCSPESEKHIRSLLKNELFLYKQTNNSKSLGKILWKLSEAKLHQQYVRIGYKKAGASSYASLTVMPLGIMFSEMYFYLLAHVASADRQSGTEAVQEGQAPVAFRIDRIGTCSVLDEHFRVEYGSRFQPGEFRQEVQFMSTGELMKVRFRFWGKSLEAVLDRLPNAVILAKDDSGTILQAEVYARGAKMWFLSQAEYLEVLAPSSFREEMRRTLAAMLSNYADEGRAGGQHVSGEAVSGETNEAASI
ncbi:helix-turn-helix transcriptional regulator [Anaerovibrio sp.]|uniref:helix-turn-helix transcriptional regulator n=1 Tax=Anaerovibrio sp. TaxID=1872532 RepID=UPI003F1373E6